MNYTVNISNSAEADLKSIFEYISTQLQSTPNAIKQLGRLEKNIMSLEQMPERFAIYDKEPWRTRALRTMLVDNFIVFYIASKTTATVTIIRVMYAKRDIQTQLKQTK